MSGPVMPKPGYDYRECPEWDGRPKTYLPPLELMKTHKQKRCHLCGYFHIWERRK